jgi:hypothetical protein
MQNKSILLFFRSLTVVAMGFIVFFAIFAPIFTSAALDTIRQPDKFVPCTVKATVANITNIVSITDSSHYPIILTENNCKGAISLDSLPGILTRAYGFIASLGLNLLFFFIVYNGFMWIYSGIDNGQSLAKAKKNLFGAVTGFGLILVSFLIVNTFVTVFVSPDKVDSVTNIQSQLTTPPK